MELTELSKLIELCRKNGIKSLKDGEFQMELATEALFPKTAYQKKKEEKETIESVKQSHASSILEAEKALLWSAGTTFDSDAAS